MMLTLSRNMSCRSLLTTPVVTARLWGSQGAGVRAIFTGSRALLLKPTLRQFSYGTIARALNTVTRGASTSDLAKERELASLAMKGSGNEEGGKEEVAGKGGKVRSRTKDPPPLWKIPQLYLELSKARLSALVVLTAMSGYALAPGAVDISTLLWATVGTALCSASANSINQWMEIPYDTQMSRTRNRVLVRGALNPTDALLFGFGSGVAGVTTLTALVNPLTAGLGLANIFLYTCVYTPLKRKSIINTWVGAIVGGIPPLMGWAACMGSVDIRAGLLAALLCAWQFPHFNSLSWNLKEDYLRAGYKMMAVSHPGLNARVSLRYALSLLPICLLMPYYDMTTWWFAVDSTALNLFLIQRSWKFYQDSNQQTARDLFFASLIHLPLVMIFMIFHKKRILQAFMSSNEGEASTVSPSP